MTPKPNQSRQPTPGARLDANRTPVARRGCARRWARMRATTAIFLSGLMLVCGACDRKRTSDAKAAAEAQRRLDGYAKAVFEEPSSPVQDGWTMDVHGVQRSRSFLRWQAERLAAIGRPAVPVLLDRLDDKQQYMRYICASALEQITGLSPTFYYFGEPHKPYGGETNWFEEAQETWKHWYEQHHD